MDAPRPTDLAFTEALGAEIEYWRKRRGLSRDELAAKAGISKSTMGRVERDGPKDVSDTWRLAEALDIPFLELAKRAEESAGLVVDHAMPGSEGDHLRLLTEEDAAVLASYPDDDEEVSAALEVLNRALRDTRPGTSDRRKAMQQVEDQAARRDKDARG